MACDDPNRRPKCGPPCCDCLGLDLQVKRISASKGKCGHQQFITPDAPVRYLRLFQDSSGASLFNGTRTVVYDAKTCVPTATTEDGPGDENGNNKPFINWCDVGAFPPPTVCTSETFCSCGSNNTSSTLSEEYTTAMLLSHLAELIGACSLDSISGWNQGRSVSYNTSGVATCSAPGSISPSSVIAYRHLASNELTASEQIGRYRLRTVINDYCPGDGDLIVRWREVYVPDDEEAEILVTDRSETITPTETENPDEWEIVTGEYTPAVPGGEYGTIYVYGPQQRASAELTINSLGGSARKRGFLEYGSPSDPPKLYLKETASGSFAGCPARDISAKTYSGDYGFTVNPSAIGCFSVLNGLSLDALPYRSIRWPSFDGEFDFWTAFAEIKSPPVNLSKTSRRWRRTVPCGSAEITDQVTMTLSEEFTTAQLLAMVDSFYTLDWEDPIPSSCGILLYGGGCALRYLAGDETFIAKAKIRYRLYVSIPWVFAEERTFTFKIRKTTTNLDTGEQTETDLSVPITFDAGEWVKETEFTEILAPETNEKICLRIIADDQPEDPLFSSPSPVACWANVPREISET